MRPRSGSRIGRVPPEGRPESEAGRERISTSVTSLIDTSVLVCRYDARYPRKQERARRLLRRGIEEDAIRVPHQAILEFVAATTRRRGDESSILEPEEARREAEEMLTVFDVLYPTEAVVRTALRGAAAYALPWFDAHLWAYAEVHGLPELVSEDFQDGRLIGSVRIRNPFRDAPETDG